MNTFVIKFGLLRIMLLPAKAIEISSALLLTSSSPLLLFLTAVLQAALYSDFFPFKEFFSVGFGVFFRGESWTDVALVENWIFLLLIRLSFPFKE